jgi:Bacteriophage Mu Gam like protein
MPESIDKIAAACKASTKARSKAHIKLLEVQQEIAKVLQAHKAELNTLLQRADAKHAELMELVSAAEAEFEDPKSLELHGYRVGFRLGKDSIDFEDSSATAKQILAHYELDQAMRLLNLSPNKTALASLSRAELKKLRAVRVAGANTPFCTPQTDDISKLLTLVGVS